MKPVSRDNVAAEAGVSSATVSRVYNNPSGVSDEKRQAVLDAAEKLGYVPNKSASALRRNGTGIITLLELKKEQRAYYWGNLPVFKWFYTDVLHAVKNVVDGSMFQLNIASAAGPRELSSLLGRTDGLICYDVDTHAEAEMIAAGGIPYVIGHHTKTFTGFNRCSTDNFEGGRQQALLLKEAGCVRPVYVTAHLEAVRSHLDRLEGFLSVYHSTDVMITGAGVGRDDGYRAVMEITGKFDGIAAVNDITAAGAGYALLDSGLRVQNDIPLVGYDNMPLNAALPFKLISIDLRPAEIYRKAAENLLGQLSGEENNKDLTIPPVPIS